MRAHRGFTLIEMAVVIAIMGIATALILVYGTSARRNADIAGGAYDLALRIQGLKGRAVSEGRDHVLVILDAADRNACEGSRNVCGRWFVLRPGPAFVITAFNADAPIADAEFVDSEFLPRAVRFDLASAWQAPPPFNAVTAWDPAIRTTCAGRTCFGLRFTASGVVRPENPIPPAPIPTGFAFVLEPIGTASRGADRRALFVSFPAGIVKSAAF